MLPCKAALKGIRLHAVARHSGSVHSMVGQQEDKGSGRQERTCQHLTDAAAMQHLCWPFDVASQQMLVAQTHANHWWGGAQAQEYQAHTLF